MELNHAELYGIDLQKLQQESFLHIGHHSMLREHNKRVEWWEARQKLYRDTPEPIPPSPQRQVR